MIDNCYAVNLRTFIQKHKSFSNAQGCSFDFLSRLSNGLTTFQYLIGLLTTLINIEIKIFLASAVIFGFSSCSQTMCNKFVPKLNSFNSCSQTICNKFVPKLNQRLIIRRQNLYCIATHMFVTLLSRNRLLSCDSSQPIKLVLPRARIRLQCKFFVLLNVKIPTTL